MTLSPQRLDKAAEAVRSWGVQASDSPFNFTAEESDAIARAAISAYLGDTHVDVPREPTKEMVLAGETALENCKDSSWDSGCDGESHNSYEWIISGAQTEIYRAMISAELTERDAG